MQLLILLLHLPQVLLPVSASSSSLQTFNGGGISFQYPNNWNEYTPDGGLGDRTVALETQDGGYSLLSVYVENSDESLEYWKDISVNNQYSSNTVIIRKYSNSWC